MNPSNPPSSEARTTEQGRSASKRQEHHQTAPTYLNKLSRAQPVLHETKRRQPDRGGLGQRQTSPQRQLHERN
ncbi:hypothetical protein GX50_02033 [[Emmonsia] crescens]|uniref:Uncharacterized protein n=1 Tax=[Emmonsia] crescens TaxID=73230 RepID=A0A2B7ZP05_9EURO|nr:hypothetical protein GX50_02033 [Emmonsia crescens]